MKLQEIQHKMLELPTIMDISDELLIIRLLIDVTQNDLKNNEEIFYQIIDALELSHTDSGFMELTQENEDKFIEFYNWLKVIKDTYHLNLNENTIDSFNLTAADVKKIMSAIK